MFTPLFSSRRVVETWKPFEKPLSLLDLDHQSGREPSKTYPKIIEVKDVPLLDLNSTCTTNEPPPQSDPVAHELKDLIHFDDGLLSSYNGETTSQKGSEDGKNSGGNSTIDSMVQANLSALAGLATTSSTEFPKGSVGLTARKRAK